MELNKFLVKAKIKTYAGDGKSSTLEDGSKELIFEEGSYLYRDRYFGFNIFAGEEVVFKNNVAIWVMNYFGKILSDITSGKELYEFLKKAMRQVKEERPFRGPSNFKENDFEYADENNGSIEEFDGHEKIFCKGQEIYRLYYHGGFVKK